MHYQSCAAQLNMSIDEYIALKLTSECFAELTGQLVEKHEPTLISASTSKSTRSGYKGVYAYGKRWAAVIHDGGKQRRLGVWDTPEEAARAYDIALIARAGGDKFAAVNFPTENDQLRDAAAPFIEKFASGGLNDMDWGAWQRATKDLVVPDVGPLPVLPPSAGKPDPRAPLIDRPPTTLYRRPETPAPPEPPSDDDYDRDGA